MSKKRLITALAAVSALGLTSAAAFANSSNVNSNPDVYVGIQGGYGNTHWNDANIPADFFYDPTEGATDLNTGLSDFGFPGSRAVSFDHSGIAGRIFAGYDFNQYFAVETGYTLFSKANMKVGGRKIGSVKTYGIDLLGKITVPVVDNFGVYAKAGPGYLHSTGSSALLGRGAIDTGSVDNIDLVYGFGAQYAFMPNLVADVSFTRYNGNHKIFNKNFQPDADLYAVGLAYKFNI